MKKYGFTLIELLIVIVIMANVVAVLSPVVNKAREDAKQAACLSNCKQMGKGLLMYASDYDRFPIVAVSLDPAKVPDSGWWWTAGTWFWPQLVYPYTKDNDILKCPNGVKFDDATQYRSGNYGANKFVIATIPTDPRFRSYKPGEIKRPADTYMFMDSGSYTISPFNACWWSDPKAPSSNYYLPGVGNLGVKERSSSPIALAYKDDFMHGRHNGNVNVAYCDGHAKYTSDEDISREALIASANDQTAQVKQRNAWEKY